MRERSVVASAACALCLVPILAGTLWAQAGRVGGIVRDDKGEPIRGATITAENPNIGSSFTASSDEKGRFSIIGLRSGQWQFVAQAPGYAPERGDMPVRAGSPNPPLTFMLHRVGPSAMGALGGISARDLQADLAAADALFNEAQWDDAIAAYRAIAARAPALSVVNLQIAMAHRNKKDYDSALAAYRDLLRSDPDNERAQIGVGLTLLERGDAAGAEQSLLKAADGSAGRDLLYTLGEVVAANGRPDAAMGWYEKAAAADPFWGKPLYKLGLIAQQQGDAARAVKYLGQVLAVDPISSEAALAKASLEQLKK
jgi:tetratricopeptide (TPR) repeat protein